MERNIDILSLTPERLAELQQAERDRVAAEQAAKAKAEEEARKKSEAAAEARREKFAKPANAIVAALKALAPDREFEARLPGSYEGAAVVEVRKDKRYSQLPFIELSFEMAGSDWHRRETGKIRVTVGNYGDKTQFPQRKDGAHSYDKIAELAVNKMRNAEERQRREQEAIDSQMLNAKVINPLRDRLGLNEHYGAMTVAASNSTEKPAFVRVDIRKAMTVEQAVALHEALLSLGLVKKEA